MLHRHDKQSAFEGLSTGLRYVAQDASYIGDCNLAQRIGRENPLTQKIGIVGTGRVRCIEDCHRLLGCIGTLTLDLGSIGRSSLGGSTAAFFDLGSGQRGAFAVVLPATLLGFVKQATDAHLTVWADAAPHGLGVGRVVVVGSLAPGVPGVESWLTEFGFDRHAHAQPKVTVSCVDVAQCAEDTVGIVDGFTVGFNDHFGFQAGNRFMYRTRPI